MLNQIKKITVILVILSLIMSIWFHLAPCLKIFFGTAAVLYLPGLFLTNIFYGIHLGELDLIEKLTLYVLLSVATVSIIMTIIVKLSSLETVLGHTAEILIIINGVLLITSLIFYKIHGQARELHPT